MEISFVANQIFSYLTIAGQVIVIIVLAGVFRKLVKKNAVLFSFIVAVIALSGSLIYSEVIGWEPCKLCWFQRIFMYPQVIILGLALLKKDNDIIDYGIILSLFGMVIATYHYLLQIGVAPSTSCGVVGYSIDCAKVFVMNFGYITIPMMSITAFGLILAFLGIKRFSLGRK